LPLLPKLLRYLVIPLVGTAAEQQKLVSTSQLSRLPLPCLHQGLAAGDGSRGRYGGWRVQGWRVGNLNCLPATKQRYQGGQIHSEGARNSGSAARTGVYHIQFLVGRATTRDSGHPIERDRRLAHATRIH